MDTTFLTIAEAVKKTGRSASTIRRVIHGIVQDEQHPQRDAVQPAPAEAAILKQKGEPFTWRIREDVLSRESASARPEGKNQKQELTGDILSILKNELDVKGRQIEKQWEMIHALNERLREGNILMGSLQKRLVLPGETSTVDSLPVEPAMDASVKSSAKPAKKKFLAWLRK